LGTSETLAQRLLQGDSALAEQTASALIIPRRDNFVERPWGGTALRRFKGSELPDHGGTTTVAVGEAFEIAAFDSDAEAARYPSRLRFDDGSEVTLQELLARHGELMLGRSFVARHGACFPLLPKTLDIRELLSVQAHSAGGTELYVIIDAEPGATIRLGFSADVDGARLREELALGLRRQQELLRSLAPESDQHRLQAALKPWFADRGAAMAGVEGDLHPLLRDGDAWPPVADLLGELKALFWRVLDGLNTIPVTAGQIIHNATPARLLAGSTRPPSAEVHALGNPERREILALEVRRPGPTFRAWDNVRFPVREVNVDAAIAAMNLRRTSAADFVVEPRAVAGRAGVYCSVDSPVFRVEHLRPHAQAPVAVPAEAPHSLHVLAGEVMVVADGERLVGHLARGHSALVPIGVGGYAVHTDASADVVKASLPTGR
jgi:Phosphomannose isomerase type I